MQCCFGWCWAHSSWRCYLVRCDIIIFTSTFFVFVYLTLFIYLYIHRPVAEVVVAIFVAVATAGIGTVPVVAGEGAVAAGTVAAGSAAVASSVSAGGLAAQVAIMSVVMSGMSLMKSSKCYYYPNDLRCLRTTQLNSSFFVFLEV